MVDKNEIEIVRGDLGVFACFGESTRLLSKGPAIWGFALVCFTYIAAASTVPFASLAAGVFMGGIHLGFTRLMDGRKVEAATGFEGFSHFGQLLLANLIQAGIAFVVVMPFYCLFTTLFVVAVDSLQGPQGAAISVTFLMGILVAGILALLVQVFTVFNYVLVVDRGLSAWGATVVSFRGVKKNLVSVILLELACGLVLVVATLLCCLPLFVAMPWVIGAQTAAYATIFPREGLAEVFD
ncbi:MAG: hypothetical protein V3W41_09220 [Planctomycetota bacterium]